MTETSKSRLETLSDGGLLAASAETPEAFGIFYDRHVEAVLSFCQRRTDSPHLAADLTAETFAAAFLSRGKFRDMGRPARAWLFAIARAQISKWLRRGEVDRRARQKLRIPPTEVDDESIERIETLVDFAPLREELRSALRELSPSVAQALILRVGLDLPYDEVSRRLGCSQGAARVRVSRGLVQLADAMGVSR
jgi:RNA polymerase sigma factor (sigma-70 family)